MTTFGKYFYLFQALVEVIITSETELFIRAVILLGELLHLVRLILKIMVCGLNKNGFTKRGWSACVSVCCSGEGVGGNSLAQLEDHLSL